MKAYHNYASSSVVSDIAASIYGFLGGTTLPVPYVDVSVLTLHIGRCVIEAAEGHKRGPGKSLMKKLQVYFLVEDKPLTLGKWRHVYVVPECHENTRAFRS